MKKEEFEKLVIEAIEGLPKEFRKKIENANIVVEPRPSDEILRQRRIKWPNTLFGLYHGIPLKNRGAGYTGVLPDMITIYQEPIEMVCRSENKIRGKVREVVMHEIGHHFGMSEEDLNGL